MVTPQGSFGRLGNANSPAGSDFLAPDDDYTWPAGGGHIDGVSFVSVNEGTVEFTVDEPGGILAFTTDTADNDNVVLKLGTFKPADGGMWMETRFKFNSATLACIWVGFTETLALDTPVIPSEFATATMTYNGSGGMIGIVHDPDATTNDFRAVMADGGANTGGTDSANGVRANQTITADEFYLVRVEVDSDGSGRVYIGHDSSTLELVKEYGVGLTPTDVFYAVLGCENRSGAARVLEVDYFYAQGWRDWTV